MFLYVYMSLCFSFRLFSVRASSDILMQILDLGKWRVTKYPLKYYVTNPNRTNKERKLQLTWKPQCRFQRTDAKNELKGQITNYLHRHIIIVICGKRVRTLVTLLQSLSD